MATNRLAIKGIRSSGMLAVAVMAICLAGCGTGPLVGLVYTNVKLPLTRNLDASPRPANPPGSSRVLEIKEPISGLGLYARINSNAIGDIARQNGLEPLYFADQEVFSLLGIWKTQRVILYGEAADGPEQADGGDRP